MVWLGGSGGWVSGRRGRVEESVSQREERERLGDWSRLSQSPLSKGTAPVTAC